MRLFIAVELPEPVLAALAKVQRQVRSKTSKGRFAAVGGMHLTLCFLGETAPEMTQRLAPLLQKTAAAGQPCWLRFEEKLRYFGKERPARVVWVGLQEEQNALRQLQGFVAQDVEKAGLPREERAYVPHVTLARNCVFSAGVPLAQGAIQLSAPRLPEFEVTGFSLMISELIDGKRIYRALERFAFPRACL